MQILAEKRNMRASSQKGWNSQNKRIYLSLKMFDAWRDAKFEAGYSRCSDSEFAAHLLKKVRLKYFEICSD